MQLALASAKKKKKARAQRIGRAVAFLAVLGAVLAFCAIIFVPRGAPGKQSPEDVVDAAALSGPGADAKWFADRLTEAGDDSDLLAVAELVRLRRMREAYLITRELVLEERPDPSSLFYHAEASAALSEREEARDALRMLHTALPRSRFVAQRLQEVANTLKREQELAATLEAAQAALPAERVAYRWKGVEPIAEDRWGECCGTIAPKDRELVYREMAAQGSREMLMRLHAIDTGLVEQLYRLRRFDIGGMVVYGIREDLIPEGAESPLLSGISAADVMLDQLGAIEMVQEVVSSGGEFNASLLLELQEMYVFNSPFMSAKVAQQGQDVAVAVKIRQGKYKLVPNSRHREDGLEYVFCPPSQVATAVDSFLTLFNKYLKSTCNFRSESKERCLPPQVVSAWAHQQFFHIHPFQDGNSRVSRALASAAFLQAGLAPVIVGNSTLYHRTVEESDEHTHMLEEYLAQRQIASIGDLEICKEETP